MLLEIDAGNSRLKWRLSDLQSAHWKQKAQGVVASAYVGESIDLLQSQMQPLAISNISRVLVSSVRGSEFNDALKTLVKTQFSIQPEFAAAQAKTAGLKSAYSTPAKLGVDRWLAMLAARADTRRACCVLDCGTTITLDVFSAEGQHLGGYIVPGLRLMQDSLAQRSPALKIDEAKADTAPGTDTAAAIANGVLNMSLGFINYMHRKADRLLQDKGGKGKTARWYITGGDAEFIAAHLDWKYRLVPDLVLDGLRLALL